MLTESFLVSTLAPDKSSHNSVSKDVGIHQYEFQPIPTLRSSYKKSSTNSHCLAVSPSHIFAAQAEKAVVHVYSRERGNQEAVVPFSERIRSIALCGHADGAGVLVLGTEGGRVMLWELCTGRQISTPQSHLQPTTCLAVDQASNFLLSGSPDSNIHLWSVPSLLSLLPPSGNDSNQPLPFSPLRSLSNHRAAINAIGFGHSSSNSNIAISASQDNTCIVWDYISGAALHTFLLSSSPICLALDPADRVAYTGFKDGSVQMFSFYPRHPLLHPLHDSTLQSTPTQPPPADRWLSQNPTPSATLSMQLSHDGTTLISGHEDGTIQTWDTATGHSITTLADHSAPITNLKMLVPTGFPTACTPSLKAHHIVKPRYESSLGDSSSISGVPANYIFTTQFTSTLTPSSPYSTDFQSALTSPTFPPSLLDASIADLIALPPSTKEPINPNNPSPDDLAAQNTLLLSQLNAALHTQREAMKQVLEMDRERMRKAEEEKVKKERKRRRRERRREEEKKKRAEVTGNLFVKIGGAGAESGLETVEGTSAKRSGDEHEIPEEREELSSSTDEISDSE